MVLFSCIDTTITSWTSLKAAKLVASTLSNGFYTGNVGFTHVGDAPVKTAAKYNVGTGASFELLVTTPDGKVAPEATPGAGYGAYTGFLAINQAGGTVELRNFVNDTVNGVDFVKKLKSGTYTFTLYKIKHAATSAGVVISSQTIVVNVTDKQASPVFTQLAEKTTTGNAAGKFFNDCFKFSFAGSTYQYAGANDDTDVTYNKDIYNGDCVSKSSTASGAYFVKKALVTVKFTLNNEIPGQSGTATKYFNLECNINKLIKTE